MSILGIDIGGTKIAVGVVDPDGTVTARLEAPTPARSGPTAIMQQAEHLGQTLLQRTGHTVDRVGVGSAGVIDPRSGAVTAATDLLHRWAGTDLRSELEQRFRLPVTVLNDVHAHAVAEAQIGAGATAQRMLLFALGTGIGGAVTQDGIVEVGSHGVAGHFGHLPSVQALDVTCSCGRTGHLEAVASGPAILRRYRRATGDQAVEDTRAVFRRAAAGDRFAGHVIKTAARAIGEAVGGMVNATDPDRVVLSGGLAFAGDDWIERIRDAARTTLLPHLENSPILVSSLHGDAAIIGAALHHRQSEGQQS